MPHYVALSKSAHRSAGVRPTNLAHALEQAVVPVVAEEVPRVLPTMPLAFVKTPSGEGFELVALQALQPGTNVYLHTDGRWIGGYRPAWYRSHPFRLIPDESGSRRVLCVDEEAEAFEKEAGPDSRSLFGPDGEPTEHTRNLISFLEQLEQGREVTHAAVSLLAEQGLIVPWEISARNAKGETGFDVQGIYHIDEAALKALEPESAAKLLKSGALSLAFSQLLSEHRLQGLVRLYELRSEANRRKAAVDDVDVESLFADDDDDDLTF
ncbi:SapC family protein [Marinobacter xestospongiae]|uniref:SapC family protein n=1 Tax=Marinobacter xestospongiae TaxID=994319 RepID=A0ABU3W062_9GAMM|nr:SapC family protein [Marinobacter xestospongiae]MCK7568906.1 SapC family protein [Marinobacter xestospongiae]MDV2079935.1 SapC family protein [Marinobacter xestospongiae]